MSENQNDIPYPSPIGDSSEIAEPAADQESRMRRYRRAADLIGKWMNEEDGYDDEIWPLVREELAHGRTHC